MGVPHPRPVAGWVRSSVRVGGARVAARAVSISLVAVLALAGPIAPAPAVAAADGSSDIPGVPLAPGVLVGPLGGDIYDVVYQLDVAPGSVILASLSGSGATDFDLYLFDGSATTVVSNQGVVARSTGPTSTESISHATPIGGRFYLDLNSATATVGTYTLVVQVIADRPAVAHLVLGGGRTSTNSTTVSASLTASGSLSGPARMAFSANGTTWGPWLAYQAVTDWIFPEGDGTKTLWAKVENAAGVASAPTSASIVLDTVRPGVTSVDPPVNDDLVGPRPTITVTFNEPIDPASWALLGLVLQTPDGQLIPGTYLVVAPTAGAFRPSEDLVVGATYVVSVGSVRDVAGNLVVPIGSWVAVDRSAPELTVAISPRVVDRGATALLGGRVAAPTGVSSVALEAHPLGALTTIPLGSVPVAVDGSFSPARHAVVHHGVQGRGCGGRRLRGRQRRRRCLRAAERADPRRAAVDRPVGARRLANLGRRRGEPTGGRRPRRPPPRALEHDVADVAARGDAQPVDRRRGAGHRRLDAEGERALPLARHGRVDARLLDGREPLGALVDHAIGESRLPRRDAAPQRSPGGLLGSPARGGPSGTAHPGDPGSSYLRCSIGPREDGSVNLPVAAAQEDLTENPSTVAYPEA